MNARNSVALMELQDELRAEQAAAASSAGGAAGGDTKTKQKLTCKQQKRKAAQRRKAEARAAAEAAAAGGEAAEGDETKEAAAVEAVAAATAQLQIEAREAEPEPKPEAKAEAEAEECAICLNDLPLPGEEGAVLLACLHARLPHGVPGAMKGQVPGEGTAVHLRHVPRDCDGKGGGGWWRGVIAREDVG